MSRYVLIAGLVVGCIAAAGVGGYLANRQAIGSASQAAAPPSGAIDEAEGTTIDLSEDAEASADAVPGDIELADPTPAQATSEPPAPRAEPPAPAPRPAPRRAEPEPTARETPRAPERPEPSPEPAERVAADAEPSVDEVRPWTPEAPSPEPISGGVGQVAGLEPPVVITTPLPPRVEPVTVEPDAVVGLQIDNTVSSETAEIEDRVDAHVTREVVVDDVVAIPAGTRLRGSVVEVERGGRIKGNARLGVRFHTLVLADGTELPLRTETIYRQGESNTDRSTAKIGGGTVGGAILGAIIGGGRGAAIGAAAGAGGGTAAAMSQRAEPAVLRAGSNVTVRLSESLTVEVER